MDLSLFAVAGIVLALWAASKLLRAALQVVQGLVIAYAALWLLQRAGVLRGWQLDWSWGSLVALGQRLYSVVLMLLGYLQGMVGNWR